MERRPLLHRIWAFIKFLFKGMLLGTFLRLMVLMFTHPGKPMRELFTSSEARVFLYWLLAGVIIHGYLVQYKEIRTARKKQKLLNEFFLVFQDTKAVMTKEVKTVLLAKAEGVNKAKDNLTLLKTKGLDGASEVIYGNPNFDYALKFLQTQVDVADRDFSRTYELVLELNNRALPNLEVQPANFYRSTRVR
jgi:hypothetical protein